MNAAMRISSVSAVVPRGGSIACTMAAIARAAGRLDATRNHSACTAHEGEQTS